MGTDNSLAAFTTFGHTLVVNQINCPTNDLYYLYLEVPLSHYYLDLYQEHRVFPEPWHHSQYTSSVILPIS